MKVQQYIGVLVMCGGLVLVTRLPEDWVYLAPIIVALGVMALVVDHEPIHCQASQVFTACNQEVGKVRICDVGEKVTCPECLKWMNE